MPRASGAAAIPLPHIPAKAGLTWQTMLSTAIDFGRLAYEEGAHLDLAFTALCNFHVVQSNVPLAMESDSFHHLDGFLRAKFADCFDGEKFDKKDRFQEQRGTEGLPWRMTSKGPDSLSIAMLHFHKVFHFWRMTLKGHPIVSRNMQNRVRHFSWCIPRLPFFGQALFETHPTTLNS